MRTSRIPSVIVGSCVAAAVLGGAVPAAAQDVAPREATGELRLLTKDTAAVTAGDTAWIALNWSAKGGAVDDLRITAEPGDGLGVAYPETTVDHSGPMNGYALEDGELDYTALRVEVPYGTKKKAKIKVFATYSTKGRTESKKFDIEVPVVTYDGSDLQQLTDAVDIKAGPQWVEIKYRGLAPLLDNFSVSATAPEGLSLEYPLRDHSSLHQNAQLDDNETDVVRLYLDATDLEAGTHVLVLKATYTKGGAAGSLDGKVTLNVDA